MRYRPVWGVEGGYLRRCVQTHLGVGGGIRFYFTVAVRAPWWRFGGRWARLRLMGVSPYIEALHGTRESA